MLDTSVAKRKTSASPGGRVQARFTLPANFALVLTLVVLGILSCVLGHYLYSHSKEAEQYYLIMIGTGGLLLTAAAAMAFLSYRHMRGLLLSQQARFYQEIADTSFDSIISIDAQHRIVLCSTGVEASFGYKPEELIGKPLGILIPAASQAVHEKLVSMFLKGNEPEAKQMGIWRQVKGLKKSGEEFPIVARIARHGQTYNGAVASVSVRDMTEHDRREELLAISLREMERANSRLRAFFALFTHELRTPLNAIVGFSELASHHLNHGNADTVTEYLEYVTQGAERLNKLVMDVLDYRHIDDMAALANIQTVNLYDLMAKAAARYRQRHGNVRLTVELLTRPPQLTLAVEIANEYFDLLLDLLFHRMHGEKSLVIKFTETAAELQERGDYDLSASKSIRDELAKLYNLKLEDVLHFADQMDIRIFSLWKLGDLLGFKIEEDLTNVTCVRVVWERPSPLHILHSRVSANEMSLPQALRGRG